jgi:titin
VYFFGVGTTGNVAAGNYIGTDVTGTLDLGNGNGVLIAGGASGNTIGGVRNIISGNNSHGVIIRDSGTTSNTVAGNYIGTDVTGTLVLGNSQQGVRIETGASNNRIGTDGNGLNDASERNVISGNNQDGVRLTGVGTSNKPAGCPDRSRGDEQCDRRSGGSTEHHFGQHSVRSVHHRGWFLE